MRRLAPFVLPLLLAVASAELAYVATLVGSFSTSHSASVTINGETAHVLLHNATAVAFSVPDRFLTDSALLASANVKIRVKPNLISLPLIALKHVVVRVDLVQFRRRLLSEQPHSSLNQRNLQHTQHHHHPPETPPQHDTSDAEHPAQQDEPHLEQDDHEAEHHDTEDHDTEDHDTEDHDTEDHETENHETENLVDEEFMRLFKRNSGITDDPLDAEEEFSRLQSAEKQPTESLRDELNERVANAEQALHQQPSFSNPIAELEAAITEGSSRAEVSLASVLLSGHNGVHRDHSRAAHLLRSAASRGNADAQALLGFLHASGLVPDVPRDTGAAILMWTFAAEAGSLFARMALAYRYFTGTDVAEDCDKAAMYYKLVADEVFTNSLDGFTQHRQDSKPADHDSMPEILPPTPTALFLADRKRLTENIATRVLGEANDIVQYQRHWAERGSPDAQVYMGNLYYYGALDMPQNIRRAKTLFEAAAAKGDGEAYANLGYIALRAGLNQTAAGYLKKAALQESRLGFHGMGFITLNGIGVEKNAERAAHFFMRAVERDHPEAMYSLALMYARGVGVKKSAEDSFQLFQAAARLMHMKSRYNLGSRFLRGISPANKDCTKAVMFFKLVAEEGIWNKIISKAFRAFERGSYGDALYRYLQAAHAGIELAQYNAAFMYEKDLLRNSDGFVTAPHAGRNSLRAVVVEEALHLYGMSASQNADDSMVRMGDLAFGEAKDYARAAAAYERASKMHNAEAMFNLGWMHARGFGMNADRHMAKRYFDQAKDTQKEAVIPATIAVYSLQYSETLFDVLDRVSVVLQRSRHAVDGIWGKDRSLGSVLRSYATADAIVFTVLLSILVVVVNARQRRMVHNRDVEEREEGNNDLDIRLENRLEDDVAAEPHQLDQLDEAPRRADEREAE